MVALTNPAEAATLKNCPQSQPHANKLNYSSIHVRSVGRSSVGGGRKSGYPSGEYAKHGEVGGMTPPFA